MPWQGGRVVVHVHVAMFWQVVSQRDSSLRPRQQDDGLMRPSEISENSQDQFSVEDRGMGTGHVPPPFSGHEQEKN